ncbi:hypothetical protein EOD42_00925 [Rhodovarius crocodyli]|uniref:Polysaccharide chain length determinant N-terminal domain-containing protein n=1 Tax=Rhodovarius crocodyli TaxID=1979269 RepID=A0A437MM74_9PROT|nr:hypothetical protein [Rhodovarius crocodyli]RVT98706.1 hypothetical protein EOD42_00925 [Rhodovarius crocodyli]
MPLEELLRRVWGWRWRLLLAAVLLYAGLAAIVWNWPRSYVAAMDVAPAETTSMATSALLSPVPLMQAGLLDSRPGGNFAVYLSALTSAEAAAMLVRDTPLLEQMTARRGEGAMGAIRRALDLRIQADLDDVRGFLDRSLATDQDGAAMTWSVKLPWRDRALALDMLRRLHDFAEAKVRADLLRLAQGRVEALTARIAQERDLYQRGSLFDLLAQQQRAALVIGADAVVAARLVSAPMVEIRPSVPNRPMLLALLGVAVPGFVLVVGLCVALLRGPAPPPWMPALPRRQGTRARTGVDA